MSRAQVWLRQHRALVLLLLVAAEFVALDQIAGALMLVDAPSAFRRPHPRYHHDLRPSVRATTSWGTRRYPLATNSLAFRDAAPRDVALHANHRRVLLIGDSFTEAVGMSYAESFAGVLSDALAGDVEVLNAGVIGYSPKIYLAKTAHLLERIGLEVDELFVFVDMSDIPNEIVYDGWEPREGEPPPAPPSDWWTSIRRGSLVLRSLQTLRAPARPEVAWNFHGMPFAEDLNAPALRDPEFDDRGHWTLDYKYAERGLQLAARHMAALADLCASRGVRLILVVYPWPANVLLGETNHPQVTHWRAFAEARGVRFVNLFPDFIRSDRDPREMVERHFIADDVHWNAAGHALVANRILPVLRERVARPGSGAQ